MRKIFLTANVVGKFVYGKNNTFFVYIIQAEPDLVSEFEWDGRDAYGQRVLGMAEVRIRAAYR